MKKTFAAILSAILLASAMTACGSGGNDNNSTLNTGGDSTASEIPEQLDISIYIPIFNETPPETTLVGEKWTEMMEAYLGTSLNIEWQEVAFADYTQKISVYLASGDWADIFSFCASTKEQLYELGSTGMLVCYDDYAEYTPNLTRYSAEGDNRKRIESPDGKVYGMPQLSLWDFYGAQEAFGIRLDAFEANGMDVPQTLEDVYQDAKQLKSLYPDSYPVSGMGAGLLSQIYRIYNTSDTVYFDGEQYQYGPVDGKLKNAVEYLSKLFAEGLLDPEYATQTNEMMAEKALNDKAFIFPFIYTLRLTDNINDASDGSVEWGFIPLPKSDDSTTPWFVNYSSQPILLDPNYSVVINSKTEYPELLVKMADYQLSDEMVELCSWGVEGTTYTIDDSGNKKFTDEILTADNPQAVMAEYGLYGSMACRPGIAFMPDSHNGYFDIYPKARAWDGEEMIEANAWELFSILNEKGINQQAPAEPAIVLNEDETQLRVDNITPMDTFVDENIAKFIAGERPMSEWDVFVDEISNYGDYQAVLDMYNQKVEEYNLQ